MTDQSSPETSESEMKPTLDARVIDIAISLPLLPERLSGLPGSGSDIAELWQLASSSLEAFFVKVGPALVPAGEKALTMLARLSGSISFSNRHVSNRQKKF